jgi:hypothetical protein
MIDEKPRKSGDYKMFDLGSIMDLYLTPQNSIFRINGKILPI